MKRTGIFIILILLFAASFVFAMYLSTEDKADVHNFSGFERYIEQGVLEPIDTMSLVNDRYYIAGADNNKIYLGNAFAAMHMLAIDVKTKDTQHIKLKIDEKYKDLKVRALRVRLAPPYFYITDGSVPVVFRGKIGIWKADLFFEKMTYFTNAVPIDSSSMVIRSVKKDTREYILGKLSTTDPMLSWGESILEKQIDGFFDVDGKMHYNAEAGQLVYLYSYRNQYIVMDKNLNVQYRANTIDTITQARLSVQKIASENTLTRGASPLVVNSGSSVYGSRLFVRSNLMAGNENRELFDKSSAIDIYDLDSRKYLNSFYLSHFQEHKASYFKVLDNYLLALYGNQYILYQMNSRPLTAFSEISYMQQQLFNHVK